MGNALRHSLLEVLTITLVASVCGAESCIDFAGFARDREPLFCDFLKLENGLPSHDTSHGCSGCSIRQRLRPASGGSSRPLPRGSAA